MLLQNLHFQLTRFQTLFGENRRVFQFEQKGNEAIEAVQKMEKAEKPDAENRKKLIQDASKKHDEFKSSLIEKVGNVSKLDDVKEAELFNVLDKIRPDFEVKSHAIEYAEKVNELIDHLKTDLQDKELSQDYNEESDFQEILTQGEKQKLMVGFRSITLDTDNFFKTEFPELKDSPLSTGTFLVQNFSEKTQNDLFNQFVEDQSNNPEIISISQYLSEATPQNNPKLVSIAARGFKEVVQRLKANPDENATIQLYLQGTTYEQYKENPDLQEILSSRFDFKQQGDATTILDNAKLGHESNDPKKVLMEVISKEIKDAKEKKITPEEQFKETNILRKKGIESLGSNMDKLLEETQEEMDENEANTVGHWFKQLFKYIAQFSEYWEALQSGNGEKVGALAKGVEMKNETGSGAEKNQFEMTYNKDGEQPTRTEIHGFMKGRNVDVNGVEVTIDKPETQIKNIRIEEGGKISFEVEIPEGNEEKGKKKCRRKRSRGNNG